MTEIITIKYEHDMYDVIFNSITDQFSTIHIRIVSLG